MKMEESEKIVLVGCIIDFDDNQVWLNQFNNFNLILNDYEGLLDIGLQPRVRNGIGSTLMASQKSRGRWGLSESWRHVSGLCGFVLKSDEIQAKFCRWSS